MTRLRIAGCFAPKLARWLATIPADATIDLALVLDGKYEALRCEALLSSGKTRGITVKEKRDAR